MAFQRLSRFFSMPVDRAPKRARLSTSDSDFSSDESEDAPALAPSLLPALSPSLLPALSPQLAPSSNSGPSSRAPPSAKAKACASEPVPVVIVSDDESEDEEKDDASSGGGGSSSSSSSGVAPLREAEPRSDEDQCVVCREVENETRDRLLVRPVCRFGHVCCRTCTRTLLQSPGVAVRGCPMCRSPLTATMEPMVFCQVCRILPGQSMHRHHAAAAAAPKHVVPADYKCRHCATHGTGSAYRDALVLAMKLSTGAATPPCEASNHAIEQYLGLLRRVHMPDELFSFMASEWRAAAREHADAPHTVLLKLAEFPMALHPSQAAAIARLFAASPLPICTNSAFLRLWRAIVLCKTTHFSEGARLMGVDTDDDEAWLEEYGLADALGSPFGLARLLARLDVKLQQICTALKASAAPCINDFFVDALLSLHT